MTGKQKTSQSLPRAYHLLLHHRPLEACHPERSEGSAVGRQCEKAESENYLRSLRLALIVVSLLTSDQVSACSHLWRSYTAKGDFTIDVSNGNKRLQGAEVLIFRKLVPAYVLKPVDSQISNEQGLAVIRGLTPGQYRVQVRHAGVTGEQADVTVMTGPSRHELRITLGWPQRTAITTQMVMGTLHVGKGQEPLSEATLSLAQVFPDQPAITAETNMDGHFAFPTVPSGLYVLNINEREGAPAHGVDGNIFIEVNHDAADHLLALLLTHTSCGLGYQPIKEKIH